LRSFESLEPVLSDKALAGAHAQDFLQGFEIKTAFFREKLGLVDAQHIDAHHDLNNHLGRRTATYLPEMKDMRRGSRENGPDSFKSLLFAAGHITQLPFPGSRFSSAHRRVDDLHSLA